MGHTDLKKRSQLERQMLDSLRMARVIADRKIARRQAVRCDLCGTKRSAPRHTKPDMHGFHPFEDPEAAAPAPAPEDPVTAQSQITQAFAKAMDIGERRASFNKDARKFVKKLARHWRANAHLITYDSLREFAVLASMICTEHEVEP